MQLLNEIKDKMKPEEFEFIKERTEAADRKILMMIKCYRNNNDQKDLVNSM